MIKEKETNYWNDISKQYDSRMTREQLYRKFGKRVADLAYELYEDFWYDWTVRDICIYIREWEIAKRKLLLNKQGANLSKIRIRTKGAPR